MRNETVVLAAILTILGTNVNAARKTNRAAGGPRVIVGNRAATNVNVSGTTTSISATIADTIAGKTAYTNIAPTTDKQAERECTNLVVQALKKQCSGGKKCKNATETYAILQFDDLNLASSSTVSIPSTYRETYCANFLETAVNKLWNSYDSVANLNEENCNVALARSLAAEACYRELLADKNTETKSTRGTDACSTAEVKKYYTQLTGETNAPSSATGDDLQSIFSKVGKMSWKNITARIGRFADLNFSSNTDEYPRELVQLVNSLKSQGNVMCGPDRYTELYDTNFALSQTTSSIEKAVQEKGILKGTFDWGLDQAGIILGEDRIDNIKQNGILGKRDSDTTSETSSDSTETPNEDTPNDPPEE